MTHSFQPNSNSPHSTPKLLVTILLLSLVMIVVTQSSHLWDKYRVVDDVQNSYWMARYQDPTLFTTDYLFGHRLIEMNAWGFQLLLYPVSLGYGLLFYPFSFVIDHIWLSKWLIFALVPLSVFYLYKLGQYLENNAAAVSLSLFFVFFILASSQAISPVTGMQRGFAVPLLIMSLYYLVRQQYIGAAATIVMSALIYWPNLPLTVIAYSLSFLKIQPRFKVSLNITRARLIPFFVSLFLSMLLIIPMLIFESRLFVPQSVPIGQNPSYQSEGIAPMFISFPWQGRAGLFDIGTEVINFIVLLLLGFFVYKVVGRRALGRLPAAYWHLLAAALIMYAVSFYVLFVLSSSALYWPSRYTRTTLILCGVIFVGLNWGDFLENAPIWFRRNKPLLIFFVVSLTLALTVTYLLLPSYVLLVPLLWFMELLLSGVIAVFGGSYLFQIIKRGQVAPRGRNVALLSGVGLTVLLTGGFYLDSLGTRTMNPTDSQRDIYEFVGTLPKDTVLAGDPVLMSGIPLFSQRSVLFRDLFPNAHPHASIFIKDFFDAQYAEIPGNLLAFCQRYQISYLVVDIADFAPDYLAEGDFFYQPFNDKIVETVTGRAHFVVPQLQPVFTSGPFSVVKCDADTVLISQRTEQK